MIICSAGESLLTNLCKQTDLNICLLFYNGINEEEIFRSNSMKKDDKMKNPSVEIKPQRENGGSAIRKDSRVGLKVALVAIMTAITVVFTLFVRVPTTKGYFNLCDVAIYFCAFSFNPLVAFISAGVGTALADMISGYAQWAPISFIVHGAEGLIVALLLRRNRNAVRKILASTIGVVIVAGGYFLIGGAVLTGFTTASIEVPMNIVQASVGAVIGFAVSLSVAKAYPPIRELQK